MVVDTGQKRDGATRIVHRLKTWREPWRLVVLGVKTFEVRRDDRGFEVGDWLELQEYDHEQRRFTGYSVLVEVVCITKGQPAPLDPDVAVLGIKRVSDQYLLDREMTATSDEPREVERT